MESEPMPASGTPERVDSALTQAALFGAAGMVVGRGLGASGPGSMFLGLLGAASALAPRTGDDLPGGFGPAGESNGGAADSHAPKGDFVIWPEAESGVRPPSALTVESVAALDPAPMIPGHDHPAPFDLPAKSFDPISAHPSGVGTSVFDDISRELHEFEAARPAATDEFAPGHTGRHRSRFGDVSDSGRNLGNGGPPR